MVGLQAQASPAGFGWATSFPHSAWESGKFDGVASRFQVAPHLSYLNEQLLNLASRDLLKAGYAGLIVEMPPRHGKSELCSHYFPAWYLGRFPEHRFVLASYEAEFASSWGRKARDTFEEWAPRFFNVATDRRSSAADRWNIKAQQRGVSGGGMFTTGVGGALTGRGANVLVVDDPVKNAAQAMSRVQRDNTWNWWTSTARTRVEPGGVIMVIMTRWHEDDLAGRLLAAMGISTQGEEHPLYDPNADRYLRIRFPALAEDHDILGRSPGDALWPDRYPQAELERIKGSVKGGLRVWEALYQQRPSPQEGAMFEREWFPIVDEIPAGTVIKKRKRAWDQAASESTDYQDPDFTVGTKIALSHEYDVVNGKRVKRPIYWIEDVKRFRKSAAKTEAQIRTTAIEDGRGVRIRLNQDPGSAGKAQVSHFKRNVLNGYTVEAKRETGSKELRADAMSAAAERGDVRLVKGPWIEEWLTEVEQFPFGAHDDQVDSASACIDALDKPSGNWSSS